MKAWNSYSIGVIGAIRCLKRPVITHKKTVVDARMLCKNQKSGRNSSPADQPGPAGERQ
jgi:hypothetical protein